MQWTEIVEVPIRATNLKIGMYVHRLDRPWLGTSFPLQGCQVRTDEDIAVLCGFAEVVYIDEMRSVYAGKRARPDYSYLKRLTEPEALARLSRLGYASIRGEDRNPPAPVHYPPAVDLAQELPRCRNAWKLTQQFVSRSIARAKIGKPLLLDDIDIEVEPMVESVVRSPDAAMWLTAARRQQPLPYSVTHPLNCCAMALVCGRYLAFPPDILTSMAKGALLMDIGMWLLKRNFHLLRDALDSESVEAMHEHVLLGSEYLRTSGFLDLDATLCVLHHHERHDGTGYPRGLRGSKVSLMGHILHLSDAYDALTSRRTHRAEESPGSAQRILYQERDGSVPAEACDAFFQSLGVYPTGTLVEMSNGCQAVVSGQQPASRVYPKLILLSKPDGSALARHAEIDSRDLIKAVPSVKISGTVAGRGKSTPLDRIELPTVE